MVIPKRGNIFAINEGYAKYWEDDVTEYVRQCKFPEVSNKPCNVPQWLFYYWVISTVNILFHWHMKPPLCKGHNRKNLHINDRFNGPKWRIFTIHFEPPKRGHGQDGQDAWFQGVLYMEVVLSMTLTGSITLITNVHIAYLLYSCPQEWQSYFNFLFYWVDFLMIDLF